MNYQTQYLTNYAIIHNELMDSWRGLEEPHERLRWAREQKYQHAADAARAMGVPVPTYISHENGTRGFVDRAVDYADFFRVNLIWLLKGRGSPRSVPAEQALGPHPAAKLFGELAEDDQARWLEFGRDLRDSRKRKR
jgi:transcriptional regulator with XRE-family HTH domain